MTGAIKLLNECKDRLETTTVEDISAESTVVEVLEMLNAIASPTKQGGLNLEKNQFQGYIGDIGKELRVFYIHIQPYLNTTDTARKDVVAFNKTISTTEKLLSKASIHPSRKRTCRGDRKA